MPPNMTCPFSKDRIECEERDCALFDRSNEKCVFLSTEYELERLTSKLDHISNNTLTTHSLWASWKKLNQIQPIFHVITLI